MINIISHVSIASISNDSFFTAKSFTTTPVTFSLFSIATTPAIFSIIFKFTFFTTVGQTIFAFFQPFYTIFDIWDYTFFITIFVSLPDFGYFIFTRKEIDIEW